MNKALEILKLAIAITITLVLAAWAYLYFTLGCSIAGYCSNSQENKAKLTSALILLAGLAAVVAIYRGSKKQTHKHPLSKQNKIIAAVALLLLLFVVLFGL